MPELGGDPYLVEESVGTKQGELLPNHLQGDQAAVPEVAREVHGGHATSAELAFDRVAVGQRVLYSGEGVRQSMTSGNCHSG